MSTARDLIAGSLRILGAVATGETPSANEQNDALSALNDMLDSWSTEGLIVPNKVREVFPLVPGQAAYAMGVGAADFNTVRPLEITTALIQLLASSPLTELPMDILNQQQFAEIRIKPIQSTIPLVIYPENTFPNETLNLWPVPSAANSLVLYSMKPLVNLATPSTVISLPPGYARALRYGLAQELAPEFGKELSMGAMEIAAESKANIKRRNSKPVLLKTDEALQRPGRGFNFYTGGIR